MKSFPRVIVVSQSGAKLPRVVGTCLPLSLGCCLWTAHSAFAIQQWNNPNVGTTAGTWFSGLNWTPAVVPDSTVVASINNAGEAVASAADQLRRCRLTSVKTVAPAS